MLSLCLFAGFLWLCVVAPPVAAGVAFLWFLHFQAQTRQLAFAMRQQEHWAELEAIEELRDAGTTRTAVDDLVELDVSRETY